ncbi:MAG: glycoside hydrolase family 13 domain protein [Gemmatimonadetes bacterium]|nr:glycoside hydrolase family 13 domain protein [Gemmatimonadota bacterium]
MRTSRHAALTIALATRALSAQQPEASLSISGGMATDQRGVRSSAVAIAPSLVVRPATGVTFGAGASATRFAQSEWAAAGGASASLRAPLATHLALTVDGAGSYTSTSWSATYALADVTPAAEAALGPITFFGGAHAQAASVAERLSSSATPFGGPVREQRLRRSRSALAPLAGIVARFADDAGGLMTIGVRAERARFDSVVVMDRSVSLSSERGPVRVAFLAAQRSALDEHRMFGSASLSFALPGSTSLELGAGTYPSSRMTGSPAGSYASAGLSIRVGGGAAASAAPVGVSQPIVGATRLTIRAPDAARVEIAGDFNRWQPVPATRAENGVWYADLRIPPGEYRYAFRVNGAEWRVPSGATAVDDDFGGKSAWLTVPAPRPR